MAAGAGEVNAEYGVEGTVEGCPPVPVPGGVARDGVAVLVVPGPAVALRVLPTDADELGNPLRELVVPVGSPDMGPSTLAPPPPTTVSTATAARAPPATPTAWSAPVALEGARGAR